MKKTFLVVVLVLFSIFTQAQEVHFGVKAGLNTSMITGTDAVMTSTNGFHAGALVEFKILGKFAIQPELMFSMQGAKIVLKDESAETLSKLNYVTVPVMAKYYVISGLFVEAGPQVGFLVSAKDEVYNKLDNTTNVADVKDKFKSLDVAVNVGVGYDILDKVFAQVRYSVGLTDINNDALNSKTIKSGVFQLSLGYKF